MLQSERRKYLITELLKEQKYSKIEIPSSESEQKILLRSLFNVRMPKPLSDEFLRVQDAYLQEEIRQKGITTLDDLSTIKERIYLWQGGYYHSSVRCYCQCRKQSDARLFLSESRVY